MHLQMMPVVLRPSHSRACMSSSHVSSGILMETRRVYPFSTEYFKRFTSPPYTL